MTKKQSITKKSIAKDFLKLTESGQVKKAFESYVADDFKHHNARFKGDRASLMTAMEQTANKFPKLSSKRYAVLEDGDMVAIQSHIKPLPNSKDAGLVYMHMFRFQKDKIVELWDFGQVIPPTTVNENGAF